MNANGVLGSGETGIAGVTVTLPGTNGLGQSITATTTTAAGGTYSFSTDSSGNALRPGTYQIAEASPSGYLQGSNTIGTVSGTADGALVTGNKIGSIALTSDQSGINYNFGWVKPVTIAGLAYLDANADGIYDSGDTPFASVTLTLSGTNNLGQSITATTTTAADGTYTFSTDSNGKQLAPGTYKIIETTPSGYVEVSANVGTVNGSTDGTKASAGQISAIALASGQSGINYDFGLSLPAAVSGNVYLDNNRDKVFDTGDTAFANLTVHLTGIDVTGASISLTATTDVNGYYIFSGLLAGTYSVTLVPPGGIYSPEVANVGTVNSTAVGVANTSNAEIDQVVLTTGQKGLNYDFGIKGPQE